MFKQTIKAIIKRNFIEPIRRALFGDVDDMVRDYQNIRKYIEWLESGKPIPSPHIIKEVTVKEYANKYRLKIFVETGTYLGEMVYAVRSLFDKIYSIELGDKLCERVKTKFSKYNHISILHGDSAEVLPEILHHIKEPCLFWLDAHYSEGITAKGKLITPILQELDHIFNHPVKDHVILIDDEKDFTGKGGYPTIQQLRSLVLSQGSDYEFEVKGDIIRIHKREKLSCFLKKQ